MKINPEIKLEKKVRLIVAMIKGVPGGVDEQRSQDDSNDPVIGGADDVHRENPSDDLRDSDLVDAEPLREDIDRVERRSGDQAEEAPEMPSDSEEENLEISNLDDSEDILDDDPEDDPTKPTA